VESHQRKKTVSGFEKKNNKKNKKIKEYIKFDFGPL
jgi:hypothetical protein